MKLAFLGDGQYGEDAHEGGSLGGGGGGLGGGRDDGDDGGVLILKDREVRDPRWQLVALLGERSSVREGLRGGLK